MATAWEAGQGESPLAGGLAVLVASASMPADDPQARATRMTITGATLFTGGGGVDVGMRMAGIEPLWGIEYDPAICEVAELNGIPVSCLDVTKINASGFRYVDVLHASPPCPSFSTANTNRGETELDQLLADKVAEFIEVLRPKLFTLENVYLYRKSKSWMTIRTTLHRLGYGVGWWHLNSADYGVPQTRQRMVVIALRSGEQPQHPKATHAKPEDIAPMFDDRAPWIGWYEAIADLIPDLPDSEFAPWQLERLPDEIKTLLMWSNGNLDSWGRHHVESDEPSLSVTAQTGGRARAFVVYPTDMRSMSTRDGDDPIFTIVAGNYNDRPCSWKPRAFIADAKNSRPEREGRIDHTTARSDEDPIGTVQGDSGPNHFRAMIMGEHPNARGNCRESGEPMKTIQAQPPGGLPRAFLVGGQSDGDHESVQHRGDDESSFTVRARDGGWRSFVIGGTPDDHGRTITVKDEEDPFMPVASSHYKHAQRAQVQGRVVQVTPRALARFQSFPDFYQLPDSKTLACKIIGNAVPPVMYARIVSQYLDKLA